MLPQCSKLAGQTNEPEQRGVRINAVTCQEAHADLLIAVDCTWGWPISDS